MNARTFSVPFGANRAFEREKEALRSHSTVPSPRPAIHSFMMLSMLKAIVLVITLTTEINPITAQAEPGPVTLAEKLFPIFVPANEASSIIFPPSILFAQAPIQVRYSLIFTAIARDTFAVCEQNSLSFFGVNELAPKSFCEPENNVVLLSYTLRRSLIAEFPREMAVYAAFLINAGLNPMDSSTNTSTMIGWANVHGSKLANHFANDGWNSVGISKYFPKRFADTTGYQPRNYPGVSPSKLRFPLRWQPLTQSYDQNGNFADQIHVTPHIGITSRPLHSLSRNSELGVYAHSTNPPTVTRGLQHAMKN